MKAKPFKKSLSQSNNFIRLRQISLHKYCPLERLYYIIFSCYRWIKLEEDIECGSKRWSKPYLPTATYKNIQQLKDLLTTSSYFMLDIEAQNLDEISTQICQHLVANRIIENEFSCILKATLLARHHHHHHRNNHKHHGSKHNEQNHQCHLEIMPTIRSHHHTNVVDPLLISDQK